MRDDSPIVCVDLDGVLNLYDGWRGAEYFHPLRPGAREFLEQLKTQGYEIVIFTVRWPPHVEEWLRANGLHDCVSRVTDRKPAAHVYVDDRAVCFKGDFETLLGQIRDFHAHWESD